MDDFLRDIRERIERRFPGATSVSVFLNAEEISITPVYHGELTGISMQKIDGTWCSKREGK